MSIRLLTLVFLLLATLPAMPIRAQTVTDCGVTEPCQLSGTQEGRSYYVRAPDGWDGRTKLPVLLHFHGWARQGKLIVNHGRIFGATRKTGVLLVAPNGERRTWKIWEEDSADIPFADAVLADVAKRFPVDSEKLFVSGYSYGSIMAWRYACKRAHKIDTVLAISGSFEERDVECPAPVNFRYVHGTSDGVLSYPYGAAGTENSAVDLWLERNECSDEPDRLLDWQAVKILPFERRIWSTCKTGKSVVLDVHRRGHFIPRFWIERQLRDLL